MDVLQQAVSSPVSFTGVSPSPGHKCAFCVDLTELSGTGCDALQRTVPPPRYFTRVDSCQEYGYWRLPELAELLNKGMITFRISRNC